MLHDATSRRDQVGERRFEETFGSQQEPRGASPVTIFMKSVSHGRVTRAILASNGSWSRFIAAEDEEALVPEAAAESLV